MIYFALRATSREVRGCATEFTGQRSRGEQNRTELNRTEQTSTEPNASMADVLRRSDARECMRTEGHRVQPCRCTGSGRPRPSVLLPRPSSMPVEHYQWRTEAFLIWLHGPQAGVVGDRWLAGAVSWCVCVDSRTS